MKKILEIINSEAKEKQLWDECVFVFDTSALLNFYEYSEKSRKEIYKTTFELLKGRLWITNHIEYEYTKNRAKVLVKSIKLYDDLTNEYFETRNFDTLKNQVNQLKDRTKKDHKHPYIAEKVFTNFEKKVALFEDELKKFLDKLSKEIETKKAEINNIKDNDTVQKALSKFFKVSDGYSFERILEIIKEGEFRYRNTIPPGYKDTKDKVGFQIYGDLISWKQIIDLAITLKKPIVLIIDDLKEDWCYKNSKDKNIILYPREELIKEMIDCGGVNFWCYSSTQFLEKSKKLLGTIITDSVIDEVKELNRFRFDSQIVQSVYEWATAKFPKSEIFIMTGLADGLDLMLFDDSGIKGIEVKYISNFRNQNIQGIINSINNRYLHDERFDTYDKILYIVACETETLADNLMSALEIYKNKIPSRVEILFGVINSAGHFKLFSN